LFSRRIKIFLFLPFIFVLFSCSELATIGTKEHSFATTPRRIVWLQIPGLSVDHLAMLRFSFSSSEEITSFEQAKCVGMMWNYNLYDLRPPAHHGLLSQMTGSQNIQGDCRDFSKEPVWNHPKEKRYITYALEYGVDENQSLEKMWRCADASIKMSSNLSLVRMNRAKSGKGELFHYLSTKKLKSGPYYDKSCQQGGCFATLSNNLKSIWENNLKTQTDALLIVRDFRYLNALKSKKVIVAHELLLELEKIYQYFVSELSSRGDLLLLTSSESQRFEFPKAGKEWEQYIKRGKNITFKKSTLSSPALAWGAGAENFCGIYEEADIYRRLLWKKKGKGFFPFNLDFDFF